MSKSDAQRAMREAKYARINASGPTRREAAAAAGAPAAPTAPTPVSKPARAAKKAPAAKPAPADEAMSSAESSTSGTCGHKSMNGRACTREAGHPEKSHRYS